MSSPVSCDKCGELFMVQPDDVLRIERGELMVDFFECPHCGEKYLVFASDAAMRELVSERQRIQRSIAMAHRKHFREKTINRLLDELDKVKNRQKRIYPDLERRGKELLQEA